MIDHRIDSHKLIYHVDRVDRWLAGKDVYPIYVEIGPSGACNHRCIFCALDYLGYQRRFIDTNVLKRSLTEMARCGVKSVMYAGEGEPFLHPDIIDIIRHTKRAGIDVSATTNGVLFTEKTAASCMRYLSWVRVSLDAGRSSTYAKVHGCAPKDFDAVIRNLTAAVRIKKKRAYSCTIGVQFLLIPENSKEPLMLARLLKRIGVDYCIIKPYSQHPKSRHRIDSRFRYRDFFRLKEQLEDLSSDRFSVIFRERTMLKIDGKTRQYRHCLGLPFWAYIDACANVWACSAYLGESKFLYGSLTEQSFRKIWNGERRRRIIRMAAEELDTSRCRDACRLDEINQYLWELRHPEPHINFI